MMRRESFDEGIRVLASVAIMRGKKILLIKEQEEPYNEMWVLPQGYVKRAETVSDAARREVREELRVEIDLGSLVGVYDDFHNGSPPIHYLIVAYLGAIKGSAEPRPTTEAIDSAWVDVSKGLPDVPPVVRRTLHDIARGMSRRGRIGW
ncbi:MAG: NUDIX hydrolase [Nitrososphaerota archaeon]|jgi:ADP-ribose pyrophosphatase YjhB (NUDIX family)|nr:NUDIX hydrolase [Nitrososphaerota archaeon]